MEKKELTVYDRMLQVFELNLNIPVEDKASNLFYNSLLENIGIFPEVEPHKIVLNCLHTNDVINVLMGCFDYCHEKDYDTIVLTSILSVFSTFKNLRYITFTFIEGSNLLENYEILGDSEYEGDKTDIFKDLYDIRRMEIHLCDSLDRSVVDFLNTMFIFYGYIPNDYMKRRFYIDFEFDEYTSFIQMIFSNNKELVKVVGVDVVNYLILFPKIVIEKKPRIRIVTNYFDL
jgi:hypothetical protein